MEELKETLLAPTQTETKPTHTSRCFSCKKDVEVKDAIFERTKNNRDRISGICGNTREDGSVCGKKLSKFVKKEK
jgi:hypothetical protein